MRKTLICTAALAVFSSSALAAPPPPCPPGQQGSADCPVYTAPAAMAVPGQSVDGSMTVPANVSTLLFGGIRPPNGFMVQPYGYNTGCVINDNGAASMNPPYSGVQTGIGMLFITPPGYRPMGPVSIQCSASTYVFAW